MSQPYKHCDRNPFKDTSYIVSELILENLTYILCILTNCPRNIIINVIDIDLNITSTKGTKVLHNITTIQVENETSIRFLILDYRVTGDVKIQLNGKAILESSSRTYTIDMPCILSKNTTCYRIQMLIPGYDAPLEIEPGTYSVTLILTWIAEGKGTFHITLAMMQGTGTENTNAEIIPIGIRPDEPAVNWITANGSTKEFALLADKTETSPGGDGYGKVRVWVWMFQSADCESNIFKFLLINQKNDNVVAKLELPIEKHGMYYQILLLVKAKPGDYKLRVIYPTNIALEIPIRIQ